MSHNHGQDADIMGVQAAINIWNPTLEWYRDLTIAQVSITNDVGGQPMESIESGMDGQSSESPRYNTFRILHCEWLICFSTRFYENHKLLNLSTYLNSLYILPG